MNRDDVTPIPRCRSVFKKQAADVEVCQAVGKVAAADLKQIRPSCDDGGQLAETLDESFGRGLQLGDIGIVRNSEKKLYIFKVQPNLDLQTFQSTLFLEARAIYVTSFVFHVT